MKNLPLILCTAFALLFYNCISDSDNYNDNRGSIYEVSPETLLANAQRELLDQLLTPSANLNPFRYFTQYWAGTQYPNESQFDLITRNVTSNVWDNFYFKVLGNLQTAKEGVLSQEKPLEVSDSDWKIQVSNKSAVLEILQIYTFQALVDCFGDIPYSESLDIRIALPKYDDAQEIYGDLAARLDRALSALDESQPSFKNGDKLAQGDVAHWKLIGNSLKVKIGINLSDQNPTLAKTLIESAVAAGVILDNSQNAVLHYTTAAPFFNPIYATVIASGRNDYVLSETIVDELQALQDPRAEIFFKKQPNQSEYTGGKNATNNTFANFSTIGAELVRPDQVGVLVEAAEINFYLAEAASKGFAVNATEDYYYAQGIEQSMRYWGIPAAEIQTYLEKPEVNYSQIEKSSAEKIGKQAWIAFFNRPLESWTSFRRLDYPALVVPEGIVREAENAIPVRYTYPIPEQTKNKANYTAASHKIGGDRLSVKIFWDVK